MMRAALISIAGTLAVVFAIAVVVSVYYMNQQPSEYTCVKKPTNP